MRHFRYPFTARARLPFVALLAVLLLVLCWLVSPVQLPVVIYKVLLCLLGALAGYAVDGAAFPYAAPDSYLGDDWRNNPDADGGTDDADFPILEAYAPEFCIATIRRAGLILGGMVVVGMGL